MTATTRKRALGLLAHPFTVDDDGAERAGRVRTNRRCTVCGFGPADHLALVRMATDVLGAGVATLAAEPRPDLRDAGLPVPPAEPAAVCSQCLGTGRKSAAFGLNTPDRGWVTGVGTVACECATKTEPTP